MSSSEEGSVYLDFFGKTTEICHIVNYILAAAEEEQETISYWSYQTESGYRSKIPECTELSKGAFHLFLFHSVAIFYSEGDDCVIYEFT